MIRKKLERVLKDLDCHDRELSILFTDDEQIAQLNEQYLGRKKPTNVLSFPMDDLPANNLELGAVTQDLESVMLGDIVISVDTALREAEKSGESFGYTIDRLLIHGILHILGYNHEKSAVEARLMEKEERRLMKLVRED